MKKVQPVMVGNVEIGTGIPKICVPVTGKNMDEIVQQAKEIAAVRPDLAEWRGDFFEGIFDEAQVRQVLTAISDILGQIPLLFTFRTEAEGGNRPISTEDYVNLNQKMSEMEQISMIDVEIFMEPHRMSALAGTIHDHGKVVVGSHHRFDRTPARTDMITTLKKLEISGADIVKLAVMPHSQGDVKNLMQTINEATCDYLNRPAVAMAMGELGEVSRVSGEMFGSSITFGCVGQPSAPGQLPVESLRQQMNDLHKIVEKILD